MSGCVPISDVPGPAPLIIHKGRRGRRPQVVAASSATPEPRATETLRHLIVAWITAGLCIQTRLSRHLYCEFAVHAVRNAFVDA